MNIVKRTEAGRSSINTSTDGAYNLGFASSACRETPFHQPPLIVPRKRIQANLPCPGFPDNLLLSKHALTSLSRVRHMLALAVVSCFPTAKQRSSVSSGLPGWRKRGARRCGRNCSIDVTPPSPVGFGPAYVFNLHFARATIARSGQSIERAQATWTFAKMS